MHVEQVLLLLLDSLSIKKHKLVLSSAAISLWQEGAFNLLLSNGLILPTSIATNVQCQGCEYKCNVDVVSRDYPKGRRYFALCENPMMHVQMGRVSIPRDLLNQWEVSIKQLAIVITDLLSLSCDISYKTEQKSIALGSLKSKTGRKSIVLNIEPLSLIVNQSVLPISELLYFHSNSSKLALDLAKIDHALTLKQQPSVNTYRANTDKKEQRKAKTQAMYQDWQEQAIKLNTLHPTKPKTWIAQKIAKMPMAEGKSSETIRRNINI